MTRFRSRPLLAAALALLLTGAPAVAQPQQSGALEAELYRLDLNRVNVDRIPYLIRAQETAESLANRGDARAARLVRYVVLLRQLAQLQDGRMVELVDARGNRVGSDPRAEAARVKQALAALRAGEAILPTPSEAAPANRVRDLLNREVSFIEFNRRVLAQAKDASVPPLERLRFLTIASSNLNEFFQVRVGGLQEEVRSLRSAPRSDGYTPQETLDRVVREAQAMVREQYRLLNQEVLPELKRHGVELNQGKLSESERSFAREWTREHVKGELRVVPVGEHFPRVADQRLSLLVTFADGKQAVVQMPKGVAEAVAIPGEGSRFRVSTDLVQAELSRLLGQEVKSSEVFRVTRNADLWGRSGVATSYGAPVRVEVGAGSNPETRAALARALNVPAGQVFAVAGPVDMNRLGPMVELERPELLYERPTPTRPKELPVGANVFDAVRRGDLLLHHPFQSYDPVVEMLEQAAKDPQVRAIRQTLYRTGGPDKAITEALVEAAKAGKEVTVLVETRARFDELNNSRVTRRLQEAGAKVIFGPPGLKTHAKAVTIERVENGKTVRYSHLATGNYNPGTAKIYTDYSFFTKDPAIARDLERVFSQLEATGGKVGPAELGKLLQAPFTLQGTLLERIAAETQAAREGKPARIVAKMNSLNDPKLIRALYQASQAGVQIDLIVRGVSTLKPGVPGLSENIRVTSLVGRFLEHTRVFQFHNGGKNTTYLASADWMVRNTERRVELAFPIEDPRLKAKLTDTLNTYLADNTKAWRARPDGTYERVERKPGEAVRNAQEEMLAQRGQPKPDMLRNYRRADGTLDWSRLTREGALKQGAGLAHFGLALFLKELAVVVKTGDRNRIEAFFDGLMTTDFYKHYGLFVAGARLSEVAYTRYLERFVKPGFVNGVLKTNAVLAAGLALPMIVEGEFSGKVFMISLTALGLSSAAVKGSIAGLKWVVDLKTARRTGRLAALSRVGKLGNVAGWFYTAAELAVVLYVAEDLERWAHDKLDLREARLNLGEAGQAFLAATNDPNATPESVAEAAQDYHDAWGDYRNFLYRKLEIEEARFAHQLEGISRRAKLLADEREAARKRLGDNPNLRAALERQIEARREREEREVGERLQSAFDAYERKRKDLLEEVYQGHRRDEGPLDGVDNVGWLLGGAQKGTSDDPYAGSLVPFHGALGRRRARYQLNQALADASANRLQSYDDETQILSAVQRRLRAEKRDGLADALDTTLAQVERTQELDQRLADGRGLPQPEPAPEIGVAPSAMSAPNRDTSAPLTPRSDAPPTRVSRPAQPTAPTQAQPLPRLQPPPLRRHRVVAGDTLWDLARHYGVSVDALRKANGIPADSDLIRRDTVLEIPRRRGASELIPR